MPDDVGELKFYDGIVEHERRIQLVVNRVSEDGLVLENRGGLNMQFDEDEFDEAIEAWITWLEQTCEYLDYYREEYRDE